MKVMTVLGTRPEIIRLSLIVGHLDKHCEHVVVHTGQNHNPRLSGMFFEELGLRQPDYYLGIGGSTSSSRIAAILVNVDHLLDTIRPSRLLILGDTDSGLAAIIAKRRGICVYHLEAGNRCYDDRVPEEINRRLIDHCSDVWMPYTERSRANLLREGIPCERIYVVGNPISEVLSAYSTEIAASQVHDRLGVNKHQYILVTIHRAENVDNPVRLASLVAALAAVRNATGLPAIVSLHPHTRDCVRRGHIDMRGLWTCPPFGFYDFVALERYAHCVLTDSGTVQEECCLMRVPCVTLRDATERPETLECGSNVLAGVEPGDVMQAVAIATARIAELVHTPTDVAGSIVGSRPECWRPPAEYLRTNVADTVVRLLLGMAT